MSRVDRALRLSEGTASVEELPADAVDQPAGTFALDDYPQERVAQGLPPHSEGATENRGPAGFVSEMRTPTAPPPASARRPLPALAGPEELRARLVTADADAITLEQYRRLAATLHDAQVERALKTVMITSALPGEGKTLTVTNLALTLAESYGRRVLVMDADLRRPSLHTMFGVSNSHGLSDALVGSDRDAAIIEISSRLSLMTAGKPGPSPLAALTSERMGALLKECAARFDWVLVDTSPVGLLPDGQVLARLIGAVILVINAGVTPGAAVERAVADLGPEYILGTVLNRVEQRQIPEAGYYASYGSPVAVS